MEMPGPKMSASAPVTVQGPTGSPEHIKEQAKRYKQARQEEQGLEASAPLSPEEQAQVTVRGGAAERLASFNSDMAFYDKENPHATAPDATPEEKQARDEYRNERIEYYGQGIKPVQPKEQDEYWTDVKGAVAEEYPKGSGKYRILQQSKKGERRWGDVLAPDAPKQGKPGTSVFAVSLDTYAKSHGYG